MPDRWFFVQFAFHQLETWSFSKKQCEKEKKKNVSSLQKASIGMLIGTLKRRFLSLGQYVDLSNWTTGVDH